MTQDSGPLNTSDLDPVQRVLGEIVRKAAARDDACLFRGEPECYPVVSSGLFRNSPDATNETFDIGRVEQEMLESARQYTTLTDDREILTEIQHFGGKTNLVDFTEDYLIALFFACARGKAKDGRVVLHWAEPDTVVRPERTNNRIVFQKSVFVRPRKGFCRPVAHDETVVVLGDLKPGILSFLQRFHGISAATVYNDIHGFIRQQDAVRSNYAVQWRKSLAKPCEDARADVELCLSREIRQVEVPTMRHAWHQRGMAYEDPTPSRFHVRWASTPSFPSGNGLFDFTAQEAVALFTHVLEQDLCGLELEQFHYGRGLARLFQGDTHLAICDFDEALSRNPAMAEAHPRARARACARPRAGT